MASTVVGRVNESWAGDRTLMTDDLRYLGIGDLFDEVHAIDGDAVRITVERFPDARSAVLPTKRGEK